MTLILKQIFNFLKLLNSDKGSNQIAAGIVAGMILGFTPAFSLQTILVIVCIFFFRIQIGAALMTAPVFKIIAYLLDPLFDWAGGAVLEMGALRGAFTAMYNMPLIPLTRFNNSVVMGSGVVALLLAPILFVLANRLIAAYREQIVARFQKTMLWKTFTASTFYNWYTKYEAFRG
jgi:uncharacterized protein (TIGR03546 family)